MVLKDLLSRNKPAASEKSAHSDLDLYSIQNDKTDESPETTSVQVSHTQDFEHQYPSKLNLFFIILSLNLALFLVGLDNTIISSAIPKITDEFHALSDVGWYASAYMLTTCSFQLMWGKLFTFYTVKWTWLVALFIFELGSLICAVAPSSTVLIVGRAIAGVGTGGVSNGCFLLIAYSAPPRQRPTLIGMMGAMYGLAAIAGPLLGGVFTSSSKLTWRFCFYINLPLGFICALVIVFFMSSFSGGKTGKVKLMEQVKQMDVPGTLILLPAVVCLFVALQWGGTKYSWGNGRIIALLVLAVVLLSGFVFIEYRSGDLATLPFRVLKNRNIWGSSIFGSCVVASFFTMLYYIPIWFQAIKGVTPIKSGVMTLPLVVSYVIFSFGTGSLTSVLGYYVQWAYLTVVLSAIGTGLMTTFKVNSGHAEWIGYQILFGAGIGCGMQTCFSAPQTALPLEDIPVGTAIVMFAENLFSAIMVSVAQNVFTNQLKTNLGEYVPTVDATVVVSAGATEVQQLVPEKLYQVFLFAYNKALNQTFYVGVALSCLGIIGVLGLEWISVKGEKGKDRNDV
ncbi:Efflux pump roqT [Penicillium rolfsii]|nr:Efflux pump roqT [Penicillium rolfsii]